MTQRRSAYVLNNVLVLPVLDEHVIFLADLVQLEVVDDVLVPALIEVEDYCLVVAVILCEDGVESVLEQVRHCEVQGLHDDAKW